MKASDIISALPSQFEAAQSSGDLFFFPSEVSKHEELGTEVCFRLLSSQFVRAINPQWEIRVCTALQKKPAVSPPAGEAGIAPSDQSDETSKKYDPFAPPYVPNLHVGDLRDESSGTEYGVLVRSDFSIRASESAQMYSVKQVLSRSPSFPSCNQRFPTSYLNSMITH